MSYVVTRGDVLSSNACKSCRSSGAVYSLLDEDGLTSRSYGSLTEHSGSAVARGEGVARSGNVNGSAERAVGTSEGSYVLNVSGNVSGRTNHVAACYVGEVAVNSGNCGEVEGSQTSLSCKSFINIRRKSTSKNEVTVNWRTNLYIRIGIEIVFLLLYTSCIEVRNNDTFDIDSTETVCCICISCVTETCKFFTAIGFIRSKELRHLVIIDKNTIARVTSWSKFRMFSYRKSMIINPILTYLVLRHNLALRKFSINILGEIYIKLYRTNRLTFFMFEKDASHIIPTYICTIPT